MLRVATCRLRGAGQPGFGAASDGALRESEAGGSP